MADDDASARRTRRNLSILLTVGALVVAVTRAAYPGLKIDAVTLGLLAVAAAPWLAPILKSIEAPGGWKLEFRELEQKVAEHAREVENLSSRVDVMENLVLRGSVTPQLAEELKTAMRSFHDHLAALGLALPSLPAIRIDPDFDNAYYVRGADGSDEIVLGESVAANRYLLFRLYALHVLQSTRTSDDPAQSGLERGVADLLAGNFLGEPAFRHSPKPRRLYAEGRLDEAGGHDPAYEAGEVWGGALWHVRALIGSEQVERAAVDAWRRADGRSDAFLEQFFVICEAANPASLDAVRSVFVDRGLDAAAIERWARSVYAL